MRKESFTYANSGILEPKNTKSIYVVWKAIDNDQDSTPEYATAVLNDPMPWRIRTPYIFLPREPWDQKPAWLEMDFFHKMRGVDKKLVRFDLHGGSKSSRHAHLQAIWTKLCKAQLRVANLGEAEHLRPWTCSWMRHQWVATFSTNIRNCPFERILDQGTVI